MKTLKKFLPLITIGTVGLATVPFTASCNKSAGVLESIELEFGDDFQEDYESGDTLNLTGVSVFGVYSSKQRNQIDISKCTVTPSSTKTLTKDDTIVTATYEDKEATFPIYVYENTIDFDPETIERYEPAEPEKVYTKDEVAEVYFDFSNGQSTIIRDDVIGHICQYVQSANDALKLEKTTAPLAPIVQQTISFIINLLLDGTNANFIGQFNSSHINVSTIEVNYDSETKVAKLSGEITASISTQLVDRTDPQHPVFPDADKNWFEGAVTINLTNLPYTLSYWQEALQPKPYWGLAIKQDWLKSQGDWSINLVFNGAQYSEEWSGARIFTKSLEYNRTKYFPEEQESQLIDFLQFQSFYLEKLKG